MTSLGNPHPKSSRRKDTVVCPKDFKFESSPPNIHEPPISRPDIAQVELWPVLLPNALDQNASKPPSTSSGCLDSSETSADDFRTQGYRKKLSLLCLLIAVQLLSSPTLGQKLALTFAQMTFDSLCGRLPDNPGLPTQSSCYASDQLRCYFSNHYSGCPYADTCTVCTPPPCTTVSCTNYDNRTPGIVYALPVNFGLRSVIIQTYHTSTYNMNTVVAASASATGPWTTCFQFTEGGLYDASACSATTFLFLAFMVANGETRQQVICQIWVLQEVALPPFTSATGSGSVIQGAPMNLAPPFPRRAGSAAQGFTTNYFQNGKTLTFAWTTEVFIAYFVLMQADEGQLYNLKASVTAADLTVTECNSGAPIFSGRNAVDAGNSGSFFCQGLALTFDLRTEATPALMSIGHIYFFTPFDYDCSHFSWPNLPSHSVKVIETLTITGLAASINSGDPVLDKSLGQCGPVEVVDVTKNGVYYYDPLFVYDGAGNLNVKPTSVAEVGVYQVSVRHFFVNDGKTTGTVTFTIEIKNQDCQQYYWNYYNNHTTQWYQEPQVTTRIEGLYDFFDKDSNTPTPIEKCAPYTTITTNDKTYTKLYLVDAVQVANFTILPVMLFDYKIPNPKDLPYTFDKKLGVLIFKATFPQQAGNYTINILQRMMYDARTYADFNITLVVCPDRLFSATPPRNPRDQLYVMDGRMSFVTIDPWIWHPQYCFSLVQFEYEFTPNQPKVAKLLKDDEGLDRLWLQGIYPDDVGMYSVVVQARFNETTISGDVEFDLEIEPGKASFNVIQSEFDLIPKNVGEFELFVGSDFASALIPFLSLTEKISLAEVIEWSEIDEFLEFDPETFTFFSVGKNLTIFEGQLRTVTLAVTDLEGTKFLYEITVHVLPEKTTFFGTFTPTKEVKKTEAPKFYVDEYKDAAFLNNENFFANKKKLQDLENKFNWPIVGDCRVDQKGEVKCAISRHVMLDELKEDYPNFLMERNLNETWLKLQINDTESLEITEGKPVLLNETFKNTSDTAEEDENGQRRLRGSVPTVDLNFGNNKKFNWTFTSFTEKSIVLQLYFEDPNQISLSSTNKLILNFTKTDEFLLDKEKQIPAMPGLLVHASVPKQISKRSVQAVSGISTLMKSVLIGFALAVMFLSTFSEASMQSLFGFLRSLQLTVHMITFNLNIHSTLILLYQGLVTVVMFDFISMIEDYSGFKFKIMTTTQLSQFNENFARVGYSSTSLFDNLGTLKFIVFYIMLLAAFVVLGKIMVKWCLKPNSKASKRISMIIGNLNLMQMVSSQMMQSFFDFCMMLFIYYRVSPFQDGGSFSTLPMLTNGDQFAKYFSFLLSGVVLAFYLFCIWFFAFFFKRLQQLRQMEVLVKNKSEITNVYSDALGLEKTSFNGKLIDELLLPKKSKILLVKKRKKIATTQKQEETAPETPIEVPISMWQRTLPTETEFQKEFPQFFEFTILKKSMSYQIRCVQQLYAPQMDPKYHFYKAIQLHEQGVVNIEDYRRAEAPRRTREVSWQDGKCPWRKELKKKAKQEAKLKENAENQENPPKVLAENKVNELEKEFDWEKNLPVKKNPEELFLWIKPLKKLANHPGMHSQVVKRRFELVKQGRATLKLKDRKFTAPEIEEMRTVVQKTKIFKLMEPFFTDLSFSRPLTQYYFMIDITRRSNIAFVAVFLSGQQRVQMMIFIAWSYLQILYTGVVWPFAEDTLNVMELFIEGKQYLIAFMIFFCQCGDALETQLEVFKMVAFVGWSAFAIEIFALAVNISMAVYSSTKFYILQAKKKKYRQAWQRRKSERKKTKLERQQERILKKQKNFANVENFQEFADEFKELEVLERERLEREEQERIQKEIEGREALDQMERKVAGKFYRSRTSPQNIFEAVEKAEKQDIFEAVRKAEKQDEQRRQKPKYQAARPAFKANKTKPISYANPVIKGNSVNYPNEIYLQTLVEERKPRRKPIANQLNQIEEEKVPTKDGFLLISARHFESLGYDGDDVPNWTQLAKADTGIPESQSKDFRYYHEKYDAPKKVQTGASQPTQIDTTNQFWGPPSAPWNTRNRTNQKMLRDAVDQ